jgi:FkbM family methyltransferase
MVGWLAVLIRAAAYIGTVTSRVESASSLPIGSVTLHFMRPKEVLRSIPFLRTAVRESRRRYWKWRIQGHLKQALSGLKNVYVVQIGSNDGKTGDPIRPLLLRNPSWAALLVEPVPFLFARLRRNYGGAPRFHFESVAIAEQVGVGAFYYIDEAARERMSRRPWWFDQIGSFERNHLVGHLETIGYVGSAADRVIKSVNVPTLPLPMLLERSNVDRINLLHIDAEGYDWKILSQLDLTKYRPEVILFEHVHLSVEAKAAARAFLQDRYTILQLGDDCFCRKV